MKILLLSVGDNGGGCYFLADAINKYTKHEARSVRFVQSWINYPFDLFCPSNAELADLIKWADVVHIRDNISQTWPPIPHKKAVVITWTGMSYRRAAPAKLQMCKDRGYVATVSTPDLLSYVPGGFDVEWLPNLRDDMYTEAKPRKFIACQAPTFRDRKGTNLVIDACEELGVKLQLIEETPFSKALEIKQNCSLVIDQVGPYSFGYGNNAIEAWAMGQPVISGAAKPRYTNHVKKLYGRLPYLHVEPTRSALVEAVKAMRDSVAERDMWAEIGRDYFFKYHHAPVVAKMAEEIYRRAMG